MDRDDVPTLPSWESLQEMKALHARLNGERVVPSPDALSSLVTPHLLSKEAARAVATDDEDLAAICGIVSHYGGDAAEYTRWLRERAELHADD